MLAGWGKNETISRIPFARFHFERVKKRFCIYTFRCVFRLNSSRLVPPFQYRGLMVFDRREGGGREREVVAPRRLCDRIGVGRKFENFQLSRSSVYREKFLRRLKLRRNGNASFTRHLSRAKFEIHNPPPCLFERISRGVKGSIVLSICLSFSLHTRNHP